MHEQSLLLGGGVTETLSLVETEVPEVPRSVFAQRVEKWIDTKGRRFRSRPMEIHGNSKNQENTLETVYGCRGGRTNSGHGCWWGCYAKFICKRLPVDFDEPVPQVLDESTLWPQLRRVKQSWIRIGIMGDPCHDWSVTVGACELVYRARKTPVVITRQWDIPTKDELVRILEAGTLIDATISAFDSDRFLEPRVKMAKQYLGLGGKWVWRVVSFHFDDTTEEGLRLWARQDALVSGGLGSVRENSPVVLETPARIMKGEKQRNPTWHRGVPEWAYVKSPTTRNHKFSPNNHNWTAGSLYGSKGVSACYLGCRSYDVGCLARPALAHQSNLVP